MIRQKEWAIKSEAKQQQYYTKAIIIKKRFKVKLDSKHDKNITTQTESAKQKEKYIWKEYPFVSKSCSLLCVCFYYIFKNIIWYGFWFNTTTLSG